MRSPRALLQRWRKLRQRHERLEREMALILEELVGQEIRFRRGNMRSAAPADITQVPHGGQTLRVRNLANSRVRTIHVEDIVEE